MNLKEIVEGKDFDYKTYKLMKKALLYLLTNNNADEDEEKKIRELLRL